MRSTHPAPRGRQAAVWFVPVLVIPLLLVLFDLTGGGYHPTAHAQAVSSTGTPTETDFPSATPISSTPTETDFASTTPTATSTGTESPTGTATSTATPTRTPSMSCCERNIKLKDRQQIPIQAGKAQAGGITTVTIRVPLKLQWRCDLRPNDDCVAFYKVVLRQSFWERFDNGDWVIVNAADILSETIIPDPPLVSACDGQQHNGQWGFTYKAELNTTQKLRNKHLEMRLRFPRGLPDKGTRYDAVIDYREGNKPTTIVVTPLKD